MYLMFRLKRLLITSKNLEVHKVRFLLITHKFALFFFTSQVGEGVCAVLLGTLIPMATEMLANGDGTGFPELMVVMATLASAGQGAGHLQLHNAAVDWLSRW